MHAEDDVVDGGREGQVVEDAVGLFPELGVTKEEHHYHVGDVLGEALLQLAEETAVPVVVVAALDVRGERKWDVDHLHLVVASQQKHLVREHDFLRK